MKKRNRHLNQPTPFSRRLAVAKIHARKLLMVGVALCVAISNSQAESNSSSKRTHTPRMSYIENKFIRLGVDLNLGGAITYLAPVTNKECNLINSHDWGRQVQLSFYSGPAPFAPSGVKISKVWENLGWNPIQSGDVSGRTSKLLEDRNNGRSIYVRCIPMHWPLENYPGECEFEVWLELEGPVVKARCRLKNQRPDTKQYPARGQELPAVYVNAPFYRLMTYAGEKPFTGGELTNIQARLGKDLNWGHWTATENWAAQLNDAGWGLGVWNRDVFSFSGGFYKEPGVGGPSDAPTGYISPARLEILDHNIVYDYSYELILGTLDEIRAHVYSRSAKRGLPAFEFKRSRCGWYYANAQDSGWPVRDGLNIRPSGPSPQVLSPLFFVRAEDAPKVLIEAAFDAGTTNATIFWRKLGDHVFTAKQSMQFTVRPGGKNQRVEVNLGSSPEYRGAILQMRLGLFQTDQTNSTVRLKSFRFAPDRKTEKR